MEKQLRPNFSRYLFSKILSSMIYFLIFFGIGIVFFVYRNSPFISSLLSDLQNIPELGQISGIIATAITIISIIAFFLAFLCIVYLLLQIIIYKSIKYSISSSLIEKHKRLLSEEKITVPLEQITNIQYTKTWILDNLFNTGTLYFYTAGSNSYDLRLDAVKFPQKIYDTINQLLGYEKSEKIDEQGEFTSSKASSLQKRLKPVAIFPTLMGLIGAPFFFIVTGGIGIIGGIYNEFLTSSGIFLFLIGMMIIVGALAIWLGGTILTYKSYKKRYYDFYTNKIEFYDGFLTKRKATIAMERITNIDNSQSLLGRIFNLHSIKIETAGSSGAEISIAFIRNGDEIVKELKEVLKIHGRN